MGKSVHKQIVQPIKKPVRTLSIFTSMAFVKDANGISFKNRLKPSPCDTTWLPSIQISIYGSFFGLQHFYCMLIKIQFFTGTILLRLAKLLIIFLKAEI
jgi:hypothetical protein